MGGKDSKPVFVTYEEALGRGIARVIYYSPGVDEYSTDSADSTSHRRT